MQMINIEGEILFLRCDLNFRFPVLRTGVLPLNHWDTDTNSESNFRLVLQPKTLVNVILYYNSILKATQQVGILFGFTLYIN